MTPKLSEKTLRQYLALEAKAQGYGGISAVSRLTGVSRTTITTGMKENEDKAEESIGTRKKGGGRKRIVNTQAGIKKELENLLDSDTFGNPENPLKWTTKSLRNLTVEIQALGYDVGHVTLGKILESIGYSLQTNKKCLQVGESHFDINSQFEFINENQPVISVDAKKKEKIGNFQNNGAEV
jgi:transposase